MSPAFDNLQKALKQLPGLGHRSAERIALHLLVERPEKLAPLLEALQEAAGKVKRCAVCGNLCEHGQCDICLAPNRDAGQLCVVEHVPDVAAIERAGVYRGLYHVLHGKIDPMHNIEPKDLNLASLKDRLEKGGVREIILALANDIEGETTCRHIQDSVIGARPVKVTRIGFGLPSGGGIVYADAATLKSSLDGRRQYQ